MNRRGFLGAILAAGAAPWVAKAGVLMPVRNLVVPSEVAFGPGGLIWASTQHGGFIYSLNLAEELRKSLSPMARFQEFCAK